MAALTAYRDTKKLDDSVIPQQLYLPVAASVNIHQGSLVVIDSAGNAKPGVAGLGLTAVGRSETLESAVNATGANNTSGAAGDVKVLVRQGCFKWANSTAGDAIAAADVGKMCFVVDDQTVALTDNDGTRSPAGVVIRVDSDGVYVSTFLNSAASSAGAAAPPGAFSTLSVYMPLAGITAADQVAKVIPGFTGKLIKTQALVVTAATTGSKAATLTPQINVSGGADAPVTGGVLALTSANMTPAGAVVAGTAVTAGNTFGASDGISLLGSAVTTFVEGAAMIILTIQATP